ncbi:MAG: Txe/YoeB family addiction module toxin [Turicibacter sp.]|nr:Txe/YoeB family addiction module toxin [Turicibacter sp.]
MIDDVKFTPRGWADFEYWIDKNDRRKIKKINGLIREIKRTPYTGTGEPERLKYDRSHEWSRRIDLENRLVYEIADDSVLVKQCKGHY